MRGLRAVSHSLSTMCSRHRQIGIAHAEIDDVDALGAQARLQLVDLLEHVRRQAADFVEIGRSA